MITQLWGVPVYKQSTNQTLSTFSDKELKTLETARDECDIAKDMRQNHPTQTEIIKTDGNILNKPELERVNNFIHTHAEVYAREVICMKQDIKQTVINKYNAKAFLLILKLVLSNIIKLRANTAITDCILDSLKIFPS